MITTYTGDSYFQLQYDGDVLDSAKGLDEWILQPKPDYRHYCYFSSGQNAGLVDGVVLTGQTSGAVIEVGRVIIPGGVIGSSNAQGILFFKRRSGNIVSGENLRVSTTTYCVSTSGELDAPIGRPAKSVLVTVETNTIRVAYGGATPTNSAGTPASFGTAVPANGSISATSWKDIKDLKMIHAASGSNAVVNVVVSF
jgi:hypothetical protein